jgi:hypothetical protein
MTQILDCLLSYFSLDEEERPTYRRYFCYHIVAGPGPTVGAGVAAIATLAISHESERCAFCETFHVDDTGGPAAALDRAVRHLDTFHAGDHLRRAQSEIRRMGAEAPLETARHARPWDDGDLTPSTPSLHSMPSAPSGTRPQAMS